MGLIDLLFSEIPEATRELDAVASLAFNVRSPLSHDRLIDSHSHLQILAFSNNNLLRLLAVLTIGAVPLATVCAILSIDFEGKELTGKK
jgi:hypothetical protein